MALYLFHSMPKDVIAIQIKSKLSPCAQCQALFDGSSSFIHLYHDEYIFIAEELTQHLPALLDGVRCHPKVAAVKLFPFTIAPDITFEMVYRRNLNSIKAD